MNFAFYPQAKFQQGNRIAYVFCVNCVGQRYTIHGFRHSMRDRLRSVECPSDIIDQIGGWLTQVVGNSYGLGHPVCLLKLHIDKI